MMLCASPEAARLNPQLVVPVGAECRQLREAGSASTWPPRSTRRSPTDGRLRARPSGRARRAPPRGPAPRRLAGPQAPDGSRSVRPPAGCGTPGARTCIMRFSSFTSWSSGIADQPTFGHARQRHCQAGGGRPGQPYRKCNLGFVHRGGGATQSGGAGVSVKPGNARQPEKRAGRRTVPGWLDGHRKKLGVQLAVRHLVDRPAHGDGIPIPDLDPGLIPRASAPSPSGRPDRA